MKIGFVLDDNLDKPDGVQQYVLTVGAWLQQRGHEVHYLVGDSKRKDLAHVHSLGRTVGVNFNQNRVATPLPANNQAIAQLCADESFDVLHVQMPYSPFLAAKVIRSAGARTAIVGTFHIVPYSWVERSATKALSWLVASSRRRFDAVASVSPAAQQFAQQSFGMNSMVIPNPVDVAGMARIGVENRDNTIVFLGRLVERKGCQYLLRAVERLIRIHGITSLRVDIHGKGPLLPQLEAYVRDNNLEAHVTFHGFVADEDKPIVLAGATIAAFPSTGGESFGIVLIEAMAAGSQVVIGGDNSGYRFVLDNRESQLCDPTDTAGFADKLAHFLRNASARQQAQDWQQQRVAGFDIGVVGSAIETMYAEAIAKRRKNTDNTTNGSSKD